MTAIFQRYRRDKALLAREVADGLAGTLGALDFKRVDASTRGWVTAATSVVMAGHAKGVDLAASYYADFRKEGAKSGRFTVVPGTVQAQDVATSLTLLGPHRAKELLGQGHRFDEVAEMVFTATVGSGARVALNGLRDTMRYTTAADTAYTEVRRIAGSGCCGFCAMLATRTYWVRSSDIASSSAARVVGRYGRARGSRSIGEKYHDHCKCEVAPVSEAIQPDGYDTRLQQYEDAYLEARARAQEKGDTSAKGIIREMNRLQREGAF